MRHFTILSAAIAAALSVPIIAGAATAPTPTTDSTGYVAFCAEPATGSLTVCNPSETLGGASADAPWSLAIGPGAGVAGSTGDGLGAVAIGSDATIDSVLYPTGEVPTYGNDGGIAIGYQSAAVDAGVSVGTDAAAGGYDDVVIGDHATDRAGVQTGGSSVIIGGQATGVTSDGVVVGQGASIEFGAGAGGVVVGSGATSTGGIAIGYQSNGGSTGDIAIGQGATIGSAMINNPNGTSVALGDGSTVTRVNTVSVGNAATGVTRAISNVAAGTQPTDAVNLQQLDAFGGTAFSAVAAAIGGGAAYDSTTGVFTAPSFTLSNPFGGGTFDSVGDALGALDGGLSNLGDQVQFALSSVASAIGGGMSAGIAPSDISVTQPSFVLKNPYTAGTYTNVGSAISALDTAVTDVPGGGAATPDFGSSGPGAASDSNYAGAGAAGTGSLAAGANAYAGGAGDVAVGDMAFASNGSSGNGAVAIGDLAAAEAAGATADGGEAFASGADSTAQGYFSAATARGSTALGYATQATAANATAVGEEAVADVAGTVSVGSDGGDNVPVFQSRIVNVANGIGGFDAVNVSQLTAGGSAIAAWIGAGASFSGRGVGTFTSPSFVLSNPYTAGTFGTVSGALQALDTGLTDAAAAISAGGTGAGTGAQGAPGAQGPAGATGKNGVGVVQFTDASHTTARVGTSSAGPESATKPVVLQNVAAGTAGTDAANVAQVQQGDAATLKSANTYTNTHAVEYVPHSDPVVDLRPDTTLENVAAGTAPTDAVNVQQLDASQAAGENWARSYTDYATQRAVTSAEQYTNAVGAGLNRRIAYALSAAGADAQAAAALAGQGRNEPNRIAVGTGWTSGVGALNVTYQHLLQGSHWAWNVGLTRSAGYESGTTVSAGASYGW